MKKAKKPFYVNGEKYYRIFDENGKEIGHINAIYEKTQHNYLKGTTLFLLTKKGDLVLEKRSKSTEMTSGQIDLISGHCDNHEKRKETVYRELKEEIGIQSKVISKPRKLKGNVRLEFSKRKFLISFYVAKLKKKRVKFDLQESEVEDVLIVPMHEGFELIRKSLTKFPYVGNEAVFEEIFQKLELFYQKSLKKQKSDKRIEYCR